MSLVGANCLQKANGGFGVLLGASGVRPPSVCSRAFPHSCGGNGGRLRADVTVWTLGQALKSYPRFWQPAQDRVFDAHAIEELVRDATSSSSCVDSGRRRAQAGNAKPWSKP